MWLFSEMLSAPSLDVKFHPKKTNSVNHMHLMKRYVLKIFRREPQRSLVYLIGLILIRLGIQITLYQRGFIAVSADEFARGIRAAKWANDPQINILSDLQGTWLPFEKYLNGLFLFIVPDVIIAPRITVFIASCLLLVTLYIFTYFLLKQYIIAILSTLFLTFQPWYVWLSGTPMLEMYYFVFFFAGFMFIILWLRDEQRGCWFWAGICFFVASGLHVQSWTFINLLNLITIPFIFKFVRQREYAKLLKLIAYYVLSNGLIISFAAIEFIATGQIFAFLANHTNYSRWFYSGYNISVIEKFLYYPKLIIQNSSRIIWVYIPLALIFLVQDRDRLWKSFPLAVATLALLLNSTMNVFSGPPSAAPGRYSLFYVIVLSFYIAFATYNLFKLGWHKPGVVRYIPRVIAVGLFIYSMWLGETRLWDFPQGPTDAIAVGRRLNTLLNENPGRFMVELHYWEYLPIKLASEQFEEMIFDREQDLFDRNTPSIFLQENNVICQQLAIPNLRYVVLKDESLEAKAQKLELLNSRENLGDWTIFEVTPQTEHERWDCD